MNEDKVYLDPNVEFDAVLIELKAMHDRKSKDYGSPEDSWANVLASSEFGVDGWVGALIRMNDKLHRIKNHIRYGTKMTNESVEDSLVDMPVYNIGAIICYRREAYGPNWYKKSGTVKNGPPSKFPTTKMPIWTEVDED